MVGYKTPVIIVGLSLTGLSLGRILGREGIKVVGLDTGGYSPGTYSKYIEKITLDDDYTSSDLVAKLINVAKLFDEKPLLFADSDCYMMMIDEYRSMLEQYYILSIPSSKTLKMLTNKYELYKLCRSLNVDVPGTFIVNNMNDFRMIEKEIRYPCIIKPVYSCFQHKLNYKAKVIESKESLIEHAIKGVRLDVPILIQEMIPGSDREYYSVAAYFTNQSVLVGVFTSRKYLQDSKSVGIGVVVEAHRNNMIEEIGIDLLTRIGYVGMAEIELKRDVRDGRFKLIEINCRPWLQIGLASKCGINFPLLAYRDLSGETVNGTCRIKVEGMWIYARPLLVDLIKNSRYKELRSFMSLKELACIKGKKIVFAIFALDDIMPFIHDVIFNITLFLKKICRLLFSKFIKHGIEN